LFISLDFLADTLEKNWVKIYSTSANYKAELIKGLLDENDIQAVIVNKKDSSYLFGELEIYVMADDAIQARHIITIQEQP
jgi:hypothetical protein